MSKRNFRTALAVVIGSVLIIIGIAGWFVHRAFAYPDEAHDGRGTEVEVDIKAGMGIQQVASLRVAKAKELEAVARDKEFLGRHAISGDTVEGYLFPDTYEFRIDEKPRAVLDRLVIHHEEVWNAVLSKHDREAAALKDKLKWSDRDILTMASIVEKEAVDPKERPRIAQVFLNRLTQPTFKPHRLETA